MELSLFAVTLSWELMSVIVQVAVGLGAVIFVHELGHFLVAKACGVKCEKFFVGFDIAGIKISRRWGETEYGIGVLPIGGYVKMLGQDDNPAKIAEEMQRARIEQQAEAGADQSPDGAQLGDVADRPVRLDPRSYLAKSVPQRMAIISAGVVMNVIFAFLFAIVAYGMGVKYLPCVVSEVLPGSPAWQANLKVGDEIVRINNIEKPRFRDLKSDVSLGDPDRGIPIQVKRPGMDQLLSFTLRPQRNHGLPTIGIVSPRSLTLFAEEPVFEGSPAAKTEPMLAGGDQIAAINGQPLAAYRDLVRMLAQHPRQPLDVTVLRHDGDAAAGTGGREVTVRIDPNPMKRLGLVMECGPISAVQIDSPAARIGLRPGDVIDAVDGQPPGDPMTLPERLRRKAAAGQSIRLSVARPGTDGKIKQFDKVVQPCIADSFSRADIPSAPMAVPSLGIAYDVLNRVHQVEADSPAAEQGIGSGDVIVKAKFIPGAKEDSPLAKLVASTEPVPFGDDDRNWPAFVDALQRTTPATTVLLTVRRGQQPPRDVQLAPSESTEWFNPDRGLVTGPVEDIRRAESLREALLLGGRETRDSLLMVYRFLKRLIDRQISPRLLGGPVTIAKVAGSSASAGPAMLLIFLTVLSANLAVINFLPIPMLDGGHMLLLALEGIFRRPVSEKIVVALHTVGFVFIVGLMLFVLALDVGLIPRGL